MWDHLRSLKYDKVLEEYGDDPVQYLRQKQVVEKLVRQELAIAEDTEPTEAMRKDSYWRSFKEADRQWVEDVDRGGENDYSSMTRLDIANRMKAHMAGRVKQALNRLNNKSTDDDKESSGDKSSGNKRK